MPVKKTFVLLHRADSTFLYVLAKRSNECVFVPVSVCVCVCASFTWPLTGLGSLVMKRAAGNRCVYAGGTLPFDWLAGAVLPLQAGRVILDL